MNFANQVKQRIGVFIDSQNLYHSARNLFDARINYEVVIKETVGQRDLIRAFAYVIKSENADGDGWQTGEGKFFEALEMLGIEIRVKDLQVFHTGEKKADWDVGIAVDMIRMVDKLDTMILMSGDGDFVEVVKFLKANGVRVEIVGFRKTMSAKLMEEADFVHDLQANSKYLIGKKVGGRMNDFVSGGAFPASDKIKDDLNYPSFLKKKSVCGRGFDESIYGKKRKV